MFSRFPHYRTEGQGPENHSSALAEALLTKKIAGAAVDVLNSEPPRQGNPLLDHQLTNLIITPHIAWASGEARQRILDQTTENIKAFKKRAPIRVVNNLPR